MTVRFPASLFAALLLLLTGIRPAYAQEKRPLPPIVTNAPLTLTIESTAPAQPEQRYMVLVLVENRSDTKQRFGLRVAHGSTEWNTESIRYSISSGKATIPPVCEDVDYVSFCRIDWVAEIEPGQTLQLGFTGEVPPQNFTEFGGEPQPAYLLTQAALFFIDDDYRITSVVAEADNILMMSRPLSSIYLKAN